MGTSGWTSPGQRGAARPLPSRWANEDDTPPGRQVLAARRSDGTFRLGGASLRPRADPIASGTTSRTSGFARADPAGALGGGSGVSHDAMSPRRDATRAAATGVNQPVVGLYEDPEAGGASLTSDIRPRADIVTTTACAGSGWRRRHAAAVAGLPARLGGRHHRRRPHRYGPPALPRQRRMSSRAGGLALVLHVDAVLDARKATDHPLPTRTISGISDNPRVDQLRWSLDSLAGDSPTASRRFGATGMAAWRRGRFGLWTRAGGGTAPGDGRSSSSAEAGSHPLERRCHALASRSARPRVRTVRAIHSRPTRSR